MKQSLCQPYSCRGRWYTMRTTQRHMSGVWSECMLVLKGHRLCIVCWMAFKGLMLHKHSAFFFPFSLFNREKLPCTHKRRPSDEKDRRGGLRDVTKWAWDTTEQRNSKREEWRNRRQKMKTGRWRHLWAGPQTTSTDVTHTYSSLHQHGRRLEIQLVLYGATVCIHQNQGEMAHTVSSHIRAGWTVLHTTGHVDSWGGVRGSGRSGWGKNWGEHEEFCVVASQTFKLYVYIYIYTFTYIYMYVCVSPL